ncbi:DUF2336 domain-containing protein [Martelella alba]|uniref:DUF2336 domain-containing protein n=1 Tax=Martelella alba TaxID=2590451 RepID=UPI0015E83C96|nr:DUF2336 domain-containing protein [Martelella alba]
MVDRYRELEGLKSARNLDLVLMATVSSFASLRNPGTAELRRFAELLPPVYDASSPEARRQAVAALSACPSVPRSICRFLGRQDIAIAAPFLALSPAIDEETLIEIIETSGEAHKRAIINRADLTQKVIAALIATHADSSETRDEDSAAAADTEAMEDKSEALRRTLKAMVEKSGDSDRLGLSTLSALQTSLLVRFARRREAGFFAETFARALGGDQALAKAILAEASGERLATALVGLGMANDDVSFILQRTVPAIAGDHDTDAMVASLSPSRSIEQLLAWQAESAERNQQPAAKQPGNGKRRSA